MGFHDHFSSRASQYASGRPTYPLELAEYLGSLAAGSAWEAGCGSGQLTRVVAGRFAHIFATDPSTAQLSNAPRLDRATYHCATAETSGLRDRSVDLSLAAQAAHWFDLEAYYDEVRRVSRPNAKIAIIGYGRTKLDAAVEDATSRFYDFLMDEGHWPKERKIIEAQYATLPFPFAELPAPRFEIALEWPHQNFVDYVHSWSAVKSLVEHGDAQRLEQFKAELAEAWGAPDRTRQIRWPIALRIGAV